MGKGIEKKAKENLGEKGGTLRQPQQVSLSGAHTWWLQRMTLQLLSLLGFTEDHSYVSNGEIILWLCWLENCLISFSRVEKQMPV